MAKDNAHVVIERGSRRLLAEQHLVGAVQLQLFDHDRRSTAIDTESRTIARLASRCHAARFQCTDQ